VTGCKAESSRLENNESVPGYFFRRYFFYKAVPSYCCVQIYCYVCMVVLVPPQKSVAEF